MFFPFFFEKNAASIFKKKIDDTGVLFTIERRIGQKNREKGIWKTYMRSLVTQEIVRYPIRKSKLEVDR